MLPIRGILRETQDMDLNNDTLAFSIFNISLIINRDKLHESVHPRNIAVIIFLNYLTLNIFQIKTCRYS